MSKLYFCEYFREGSGYPVNLSIGMQSMESAEHRGKVVTKLNGYCGFWILSKPAGCTDEPKRIVYHSAIVDPRGVTTWRKPIKADGGAQ
jgi:hypothetical protein